MSQQAGKQRGRIDVCITVSRIRVLVLCVAVNLTALTAHAIQSEELLFWGEQAYVGKRMEYPVIGDLNGDDLLDFAAISGTDQTVIVAFNRGNSLFEPPMQITTGRDPGSLIMIDANRDGHQDLIVLNRMDNDVSVLLNNGHGSFTNSRHAAGDAAKFLVAGDLNNDKYPDLLTTSNSGVISVLLNDHKGGYKGVHPLGIRSNYGPPVLFDNNDDGFLDIVVLGPTISVHFGHGDGTFDIAWEHRPVHKPIHIAGHGWINYSADIDGDHRSDLIVKSNVNVFFAITSGSKSLRQTFSLRTRQSIASTTMRNFPENGLLEVIILSKKNPLFTVFGTSTNSRRFEPKYEYETDHLIRRLTSLDVNSDGTTDLVGFGNNVLVVYQSQKDGTFAKAEAIPCPANPKRLVSTQLDRRGRSDLMALGPSGIVQILASEMGGYKTPSKLSVDDKNGKTPSAITLADLDSDGNMDLITIRSGGKGKGIIFPGNGDGSFRDSVSLKAGTSASTIIVEDFNEDGVPDLCIPNINRKGVEILLGNGDFSFRPPLIRRTSSKPESICTADVDNDGHLDLIVTPAQRALYVGTGQGTFMTSPNGLTLSASRVIAADLNLDGHVDLVTIEKLGVVIRYGRERAYFQDPIFLRRGIGFSDVTTGDFNGDGLLDILVTRENPDEISVHLNTRDGTFRDPVLADCDIVPVSVVAKDINNDGRLDLLVRGRRTSNVVLLIGTGNGTFLRPRHIPGGFRVADIAVADLDNDHDLDLVTACSRYSDLFIFLNQKIHNR